MNFTDKATLFVMGNNHLRNFVIKVHSNARALSFIESLLVGKKILDAGCGLGLSGEYFSSKSFSVIGLELDHELSKQASGNLSYGICNASASSMPFPDESFDSVTFINVMHHIPREKHLKAIEEAARVLREGGAIIIAEPKKGSFFNFVWDKVLFNDSFQGYFNLEGNFDFFMKHGMRIFKIAKKEAKSIRFDYAGE